VVAETDRKNGGRDGSGGGGDGDGDGDGNGDGDGRGGDVRLQYAGLSRGDDPGLERAVDELAEAHLAELGVDSPKVDAAAAAADAGQR